LTSISYRDSWFGEFPSKSMGMLATIGSTILVVEKNMEVVTIMGQMNEGMPTLEEDMEALVDLNIVAPLGKNL